MENKFICAKSKSLYVECLSKKGITKIYDLFNRDEVFKNWDSVSQESETNAFFWNGMVF